MSSTIKQSPQELGFFMPAEWQQHESTWLAWPQNPETWTEDIDQVERTFIEMMRHISQGETVNLLCNGIREIDLVRDLLKEYEVSHERICFFDVPTVDVWIRDYGPNFLIREKSGKKELAYNRWTFNAWGNKYPDLARDNEVLDQLERDIPATKFDPKIVLEGGSIEVDGAGACLTTEQCLLNPNRNPGLNKEQIETLLKNHLNLDQTLWLGEGIVGDDTDGHIDDIARFVAEDTIVTVIEDDPQDENYKLLQDNLKRLKSFQQKNQKPFRIVPLPMPGTVEYQGTRLPASYANFYISNHTVIMPTFGHANDQKALTVLDSLFSDRKVVGIDCQVMVRGLGTLHCASQQQPAL